MKDKVDELVSGLLEDEKSIGKLLEDGSMPEMESAVFEFNEDPQALEQGIDEGVAQIAQALSGAPFAVWHENNSYGVALGEGAFTVYYKGFSSLEEAAQFANQVDTWGGGPTDPQEISKTGGLTLLNANGDEYYTQYGPTQEVLPAIKERVSSLWADV